MVILKTGKVSLENINMSTEKLQTEQKKNLSNFSV